MLLDNLPDLLSDCSALEIPTRGTGDPAYTEQWLCEYCWTENMMFIMFVSEISLTVYWFWCYINNGSCSKI